MQAHIHKGAAGVNGEIIVWLYPINQTAVASIPVGSIINGLLAQVSHCRFCWLS
jgi:hypothetical protein